MGRRNGPSEASRYFVSRQRDSYADVDADAYYVEIAVGGETWTSGARYGGQDFANPGMLGQVYGKLGEMGNYDDPREAAKDALAIRDAWKQDAPLLNLDVRCGCTYGGTAFFEPATDDEVNAWAEREYAELPKCDQCGTLIVGEVFHPDGCIDAGSYCSENCVEETWVDLLVDDGEVCAGCRVGFEPEEETMKFDDTGELHFHSRNCYKRYVRKHQKEELHAAGAADRGA